MSRQRYSVRTGLGSVAVEGSALAALVESAAERVDGARVRRPRRGLDVTVSGDRVAVELELAARYGAVLPSLGRDVQAAVAQALRDATGLTVAGVEVTIEELDA